MRKCLMLLAVAIMAALPALSAFGQGVVMTRDVEGLDPSGYFIPGTTSLDITLTLTEDVVENITAMGISEDLPPGWTFNSIVESSSAPQLPPPPNASGTIDFAWFAIPPFPLTVTYRVNVPVAPGVPVDLTGRVEYRTGGPALFSSDGVCAQGDPPTTDICPTVTTFELEPTLLTAVRVVDPASTGLFEDDPSFFVPGGFLDITVQLNKSGTENITALGWTDVVPANWTISNIGGANPPNLAPAVGSSGSLEFAWFAIPAFPASFSYRINIPNDATGTNSLTGQAEYRLGGPAILTDPEVLTLNEVPCLSIARPQPPNPVAYAAGNNLTVTVEIDGSSCGAITALGVTEQLPAGWAFVSAGGANPPNLSPAPGTQNTLEFAYFAIPAFPASFTYTVSVPAETEGTQTISGQAEYRLGGPALLSIPVSTDFLGIDLTPPVITRLGDEFVTVECGDAYVDAGATALDDFDGDITANIVVGGLPIPVNTPGVYTVTYDVSDDAGNVATQVTRTVTVEDTVAPTLTLNGDAALTIECGSAYNDAGATASDACQGNITASIQVSGTVNPLVPGLYTLTYNVSDASGNAAVAVQREVTVADSVAPVITLNGGATVTVECGTAFTDPGATASDSCDGAVAVNASGAVNTAVPGSYNITYNAQDTAGNNAVAVVRTVNVVDTVAPVISLVGDAAITLNQNAPYSESGANVADACDAGVVVVIDSSAVNTAVPGTYQVTYNATDASGNAATTVIRTVTVVDITPPVIVLNGDAAITLQCGIAFTDPGATASDNTDGNISANIVVTGSVGSAPGVYTLTYNVSDAAGNPAEAVTRTVTVEDTVAPVITLTGDPVVEVECGAAYTDAGATVADICDSTVTLVTAGSVDTATPGSYTITYNATDASGNAAVEVTRTVNVVDSTAPVITLNGDAVVTVECGGTFSDAGATASDACDTDVEVNASGSVDTATPGSYTISYDASDATGNVATTVTRTVNVVDTAAPVVTIDGGNALTVDCQGSFDAPAATAVDGCDGDVSDSLIVIGTVDTNVPGEYTVLYEARDAAGNIGTATLVVTVADNCPGEGDGEAEGVEDVCDVVSVAITSPTADIVVPAGSGSTPVVLSAEVTLADVIECDGVDVEVVYSINGNVVGSSQVGDDYSVTVSLDAGTYQLSATASVVGGDGASATATRTFSIIECADADNNGILDDPFALECLNGATTWSATVQGENCLRQVVMRTWFGDGLGGTLVLTAVNPEDTTQSVSVRIPRNLLAVGQQGVAILSISCDLASLFGVDVADAIGEPTVDFAAGAAYFDLTILVSDDGGETVEEIDNSLVDVLPIQLSLSGLNIAPGLVPTFFSHPTGVQLDPVVIVDEEGSWDNNSVFGGTFGAGTLTASTRSLSVFVPAQINPVGPTISVSPNPAFEALFGIARLTETVTKTFTVTNIGSGTVVGQAVLTDPSSAFGLVGTTSYSIAAGQSRTITARFAPSEAGSFTAQITFTGGDNGPLTVTIKGTGSDIVKERSFLGCAPAPGSGGTGMGDLMIVLVAAMSLLAGTTLVRRTRREH